jgi:hypothetical protein
MCTQILTALARMREFVSAVVLDLKSVACSGLPANLLLVSALVD